MANDSEVDSTTLKDPSTKRRTGTAAGAKPAAERGPKAGSARAGAARAGSARAGAARAGTALAAGDETADADAASGEGATGSLRKKDLLDRVGAKAKVKKKDIKEVVEATLLVLGEALAAGEELNLPPLGKAKVNRQKGVAGGDMYIIKLRRSTGKTAGADQATEALAEAED